MQKERLDELNELIAAEQETLDETLKEMEEQEKINTLENHKNRNLSQTAAALSAQLKFIEEHYDYSEQVNALNSELFSEVSKTNDNLKMTFDEFVGKLNDLKTELTRLEAMKMAF